jgi:predicted N-acetyltransferase YhbS
MPHIIPLRECPQHIEQLATWHFGEWGDLNPANDVPARVARFHQQLLANGLPTTWVAVDEQNVLGSASLVAHDLELRSHLTPWLASVFVAPAQRGRGIGRSLVRRVMDHVEQLEIPRFYLFTMDQESFYRELGWETLEKLVYCDRPIVVMQYTCPAAAKK